MSDIRTQVFVVEVSALMANMPTPAEFERILREKYEPLLSAEDYARLRTLCGLGAVIDGEVIQPRPALTDASPST